MPHISSAAGVFLQAGGDHPAGLAVRRAVREAPA